MTTARVGDLKLTEFRGTENPDSVVPARPVEFGLVTGPGLLSLRFDFRSVGAGVAMRFGSSESVESDASSSYSDSDEGLADFLFLVLVRFGEADAWP